MHHNKPAGGCHAVSKWFTYRRGHRVTLTPIKRPKVARPTWMVSALTLMSSSLQDGHLILHRVGEPGMFPPSGNAITECSSVLIDWNEVIWSLLTTCVIYVNDSLCWLICFNPHSLRSCLDVYCGTLFSRIQLIHRYPT